jgi:hypothetical protein
MDRVSQNGKLFAWFSDALFALAYPSLMLIGLSSRAETKALSLPKIIAIPLDKGKWSDLDCLEQIALVDERYN